MKLYMCLLVLALAGCASSGVRISDEQLSMFQSGVTSREDVLQALGVPNFSNRLPDGSSILVYSHAQVNTRPETFIPIVGAFVGGADAYTSTTTLRFDADGKLVDSSTAEGATGSGLGFASGAPRPRQ